MRPFVQLLVLLLALLVAGACAGTRPAADAPPPAEAEAVLPLPPDARVKTASEAIRWALLHLDRQLDARGYEVASVGVGRIGRGWVVTVVRRDAHGQSRPSVLLVDPRTGQASEMVVEGGFAGGR